MHSLSLADLRAFIMAQPDERPLRLYEGYIKEETGCVLHHYCKEKEIEFEQCLFSCAFLGEEEDPKRVVVLSVEGHGVLDLFEGLTPSQEMEISTYGELKNILLPE